MCLQRAAKVGVNLLNLWLCTAGLGTRDSPQRCPGHGHRLALAGVRLEEFSLNCPRLFLN